MTDSNSRTDPLRHVRFVGRPTTAAPRQPKRANPPASPADESDAAHEQHGPGPFLAWVLGRAGLAVADYRGEPLGRRLSACLRALHANSEQQARQVLEQRPEMLSAAVSALLIGVTSFFRDGPVFEALRSEVLPELAGLGRPLRVWSAGGSNGAELFSVAILLERAGLLEVAGRRSFLLGSDCRREAVEHASQGLYTCNDLRMVAPADRHRYFEQAGSKWRPIEPLRRCVHWQEADLGRCIAKGPWDMILWRNMAIYLQAAAAGRVWRHLASVLGPHGVLVVGKAERPPADLALICMSRCIYHASPRGPRDACGAEPRPTSHRSPRASEKFV